MREWEEENDNHKKLLEKGGIYDQGRMNVDFQDAGSAFMWLACGGCPGVHCILNSVKVAPQVVCLKF